MLLFFCLFFLSSKITVKKGGSESEISRVQLKHVRKSLTDKPQSVSATFSLTGYKNTCSFRWQYTTQDVTKHLQKAFFLFVFSTGIILTNICMHENVVKLNPLSPVAERSYEES